MGKDAVIEPETYTVEEACKRHAGMKPKQMQILCITGQFPHAKKIGKFWHIPKSDLDKYFKKGGGFSAS